MKHLGSCPECGEPVFLRECVEGDWVPERIPLIYGPVWRVSFPEFTVEDWWNGHREYVSFAHTVAHVECLLPMESR